MSRVKAELVAVKGRSFPKKFTVALSRSLVNLLAKTCKPINGYRPPVEIQGDLND